MQWLQKPLVIFLHNILSRMFVKACSCTVVSENRSMVLLAAGDRVGDNSVSSCVLWVGVLPDLTPQLAFELDCNLGRLSCLALFSDATFSFNFEQLLEFIFMVFLSMVTVCESTVNEMYHSPDILSLSPSLFLSLIWSHFLKCM